MPDSSAPMVAITTSLRLAKSLELARRGQLKAAQSVFGLGSQLPEDSLELHALAALVTKEGDFTRALQLWRMLLSRVPNHVEARRMISAIELWQLRPAWYGIIPWVAGVAGALIVIVGFFALISEPPPRPKPFVVKPSLATPTQAPVSSPTRPAEQQAAPGIKFTPTKPNKTTR